MAVAAAAAAARGGWVTSSASLVERARGGAEDAAVRVRRKRPFVDHLVLALSRYQADAGNRLAAAVSYYGFLSFFPLVALAFSITGFVIDAYPEAQQNLIDQINTFLPGLADKLNIASIGNVKVASGIIGIVGLLITGLAWVNALREAMRTMWHHNIQVGNILVRWLHDTFILLGLGLALLLTTAVSGAASAGIGLVLDALDLSGSTVATYLLRIVSLLLAVAADTVIYAFLFTRLPRVAVPMRRVLRGALFAAIGLELIKVGAAYLIPQKVSNPIYLTFGVLFGLLIWINIVSRWSLLAAAWTVTEPYDADVAPSGTASVDMAQKAGIPEEYASSDPAAVLTTFGGGVPSPLYGAIQAKSPVAAAEPGFGGGPASGAGPGLPGVRVGACLPGVRDAAKRPSAVWQGGAHAPHHSPYGYAPARPGCLDRRDLARLPAPACRRPRAQDVLLRGPRRAHRGQPGDGGGARAHRSADQAHASVRGRRGRNTRRAAVTFAPGQPRDREFDLVVYGATGFVGRLLAAYLAEHAAAGVRLGLAGRSAERLAAVREGLGAAAADWTLIVADSGDPAALAALTGRTRVVATTVGPYAKYGIELVEACARAGTHYADLTGEVLFVRDSIDRAHELARSTGARIVHATGFDSVPSDLGVLLAYERARADDAGDLTDTTLVVVSLKGGISGGTIDSLRGQVDAARTDAANRRLLADPYALSPDRPAEPDLGKQPDAFVPRFDKRVSGWIAPFVMGPFNTRIVRRSNALQDWSYGRRFCYREVHGFGNTVLSPALALGAAAMLGSAALGFSFPPTRAGAGSGAALAGRGAEREDPPQWPLPRPGARRYDLGQVLHQHRQGHG